MKQFNTHATFPGTSSTDLYFPTQTSIFLSNVVKARGGATGRLGSGAGADGLDDAVGVDGSFVSKDFSSALLEREKNRGLSIDEEAGACIRELTTANERNIFFSTTLFVI